MRVAVVGCGPKGLFALERLLHHAGLRAAGLSVDVFEPHESPGAGPVYDPAQPGWLRMNFAAEHLDMWWPGGGCVPPAERRSFLQWCAASEPGDYPSRARVGSYLSEGLELVRRYAPEGVELTVRRRYVEVVSRADERWQLTTDDRVERIYDEVLVATGHPDVARGSVFPVDRCLSPARVPPSSTVAVRGFALTFIDAALTLTEGRGGAFLHTDHPHRLRYVPSGDEPAAILPFSRSGRPMLAKPDPALAASLPELNEVAAAGRAAVKALPADSRLDTLVAVFEAAASEALATARDETRPAGRPGPIGPIAELERSLNVGAGLLPPDQAWALGHTWRALYPAIVDRCSGTGLPDEDWPRFRRLAAQMERIAFGPPPENAAKLVALVRSGHVDLSHVRGGAVRADRSILSSAAGEQSIDGVIDAVLASPGVASSPGLFGTPIAEGHMRVRPGRRGIDVTDDAGCIGRDGRPVVGLSVLGRASEDAVIGNDTLNRTLHPHPDRWAARVAARAASRVPAPVA